MTIISPKNDIVFQKLFGEIGNEKLTKRLVSLIVGKEIEGIDLDVSNRIERDSIEEKLGLLDVRAKLKTGEEVNIEMQVRDSKEMPERMLYYWSKLYGRKLKKGEGYGKLKATISILITDYEIERIKEIKKYHTVWKLREEEVKEKILTENMEIHIIELPKVRKEDMEKELGSWMMFLKNPESKEVEEKMEEDEVLKQAMEELRELSGREDFRRLVELREKGIRDEISQKIEAREEGIEEGKKEGKREGKKEKEREIVKNMLEENFSIDQICKIVNLDKKEIEKIQQEDRSRKD